MTTPSIQSHNRAFTLIELLVVITIIAILAAFAVPAFRGFLIRARIGDQVNNGRQIYLGMKNFSAESANGGRFPLYRSGDDANALLSNSNEAFETLLPRYLDTKSVCINRNSAWCRQQPASKETKHKVLSGENDWAYVRGLSDTSQSDYPVLANAFSPGSKTYTTNPGEKGGVWLGLNAVVIYMGGSAQIVATKEGGGGFMVPRADNPGSNAFEKDDEWLAGEDVEVLQPL